MSHPIDILSLRAFVRTIARGCNMPPAKARVAPDRATTVDLAVAIREAMDAEQSLSFGVQI